MIDTNVQYSISYKSSSIVRHIILYNTKKGKILPIIGVISGKNGGKKCILELTVHTFFPKLDNFIIKLTAD